MSPKMKSSLVRLDEVVSGGGAMEAMCFRQNNSCCHVFKAMKTVGWG